ncbi:MAG: PhoH family protein [Planctomycetota bacterium]
MERTLRLPTDTRRVDVAGPSERNLKIIREALGVKLSARSELVRITGDPEPVEHAAALVERLVESARNRQPLSRQELLDAVATVASTPSAASMTRPPGADGARSLQAGVASPGDPAPAATVADDLAERQGFEVYLPGRLVRPMTPGQHLYAEAIARNDLVFCTGPAGSGKTYLAVAAAAAMLKRGRIRKIVLVRPAVEAGERIGFLPGTLQEKVNPYLRPLLDALHDMMEFEHIQRLTAADLIEIIPLAFMRGRTLNDACVILDEAQNTTRSQMLMFLTRLGHGSKMIVTGDVSQTDLEHPADSGLIDAIRRLRLTRGVATIALEKADIVRHELVQRVVEAYGPPAGKLKPDPAPQTPEAESDPMG